MSAAMNTAISSPPQIGGALLPNSLSVPLDSPPKLVYGLVIIVLIVFVDLVPAYIRDVADSVIGRLIGVGLVAGVTLHMGWSYGLLTALAFLLVVRGARRLSGVADMSTDTSPLMAFLGIGGPTPSVSPLVGTEGFQNQLIAEAVGKRWYIEKVLGENPIGVVTTTTETMAVQDSSQKNMGATK